MVKKIVIDQKYDGARLNRFFEKEFPSLARVNLEKLLRKGQIRVNKGRCKASLELKIGDEISAPEFMNDFISKPLRPVEKIEQELLDEFKSWIIYQDEFVLMVNKPAGMASQKGKVDNIAMDVIAKDFDENLKLLHRLDKDTSGLLMFAKGLKSAKKFSEYFKENEIQKMYVAFVNGNLPQQGGEIKSFLFENENTGLQESTSDISGIRREDRYKYKRALTEFDVLDTVAGKTSFVRLMPTTGRKHQLRVHMANLECPILGDKKYSDMKIDEMSEEWGIKIPRNLFLHAWQVQFFHPMLRKEIKVKAPLPDHFKKIMKYFEISL